MAIYHLCAQVIKRSEGRSSVACAAYRSASKITDERTGLTHNYTRKQCDFTQILLPPGSPDWMKDRARLWNEVERNEKRKDAQLAREFNIALPHELDNKARADLVRSFCREQFVAKGLVADFALHEQASNNPHVHVMTTMRATTATGFGPKLRELNDKEQLIEWRKSWAEHVNRALLAYGFNERIDHRSLEAQAKTESDPVKRRELTRLPTIHRGFKCGPERRRMARRRERLRLIAVRLTERVRSIRTERRRRDAEERKVIERSRFLATRKNYLEQQQNEQAKLSAMANQSMANSQETRPESPKIEKVLNGHERARPGRKFKK